MIYDIKDYLNRFFKSRLTVLATVMFLLFAIILVRVFSLQIIILPNWFFIKFSSTLKDCEKSLFFMKKIITLLAIITLSMTACADRHQTVAYSEIPVQAQAFIEKYFKSSDVVYIVRNKSNE